MSVTDIKNKIRTVPDFPKPGIMFRDITTLLQDAAAYRETIELLYQKFTDRKIDYIAAIESRGYLFGAPLALKLGAGLALIRKPGKLPAETLREEYALEYGSDAVEIHKDAIEPGKNVLIIDDLLATGGTAAAACRLIQRLNARITAAAFIIELKGLNGREILPADTEIFSLIQY